MFLHGSEAPWKPSIIPCSPPGRLISAARFSPPEWKLAQLKKKKKTSASRSCMLAHLGTTRVPAGAGGATGEAQTDFTLKAS